VIAALDPADAENVGFRPSFELDRSPRWSPFPLH
jgi:hypothetical protein